MDELPSATFRKTYAKLTRPTTVTVNGHVIGQWIPEGSATYVAATVRGEATMFGLAPPPEARTRHPRDGDPTFNSRPFTPRLDVERLRQAVEYIVQLHSEEDGGGMGYLADGGYGHMKPVCQTCGTAYEYGVLWPCSTRQHADNALHALARQAEPEGET